MSRPLPPHCDQAHEAIRAELVRLTLPHHPGSDRPALELVLPDPKKARPPRTSRTKSR